MLRNIIGPVFNLKNVFLFVVFCLFFKIPLLFCRENEIFKNIKTKKPNIGPVLTLKGQKLDQFLTLQHIYIYMRLGASNLTTFFRFRHQ